MTSRIVMFSLAALVIAALSGCAPAGGTGNSAAGAAAEGSSAAGGAIELAISEMCADSSDPQCISINGEDVVRPSTFEQASVADASVAEGVGQNAIDVTFTESGAKVLNELTADAASAGDAARLVVKIGGEITAAVVVMEPLEGDEVQFSLSTDVSAQDVVDLIRGD